MTGTGSPSPRWSAHPATSPEQTMTFSTDLDAFLAKVQLRIDAAMGEAREELKEMAVEAEQDWSELRQRFADGCCEPARAPEAESTSQPETSTNQVGEEQPG
jgi:hypothetical protein